MIGIAILVIQIGPSGLVGVAFMFLAMPLPMWAMKTLYKIRDKIGKLTDDRAKLTYELLGGMKIIKFFGTFSDHLHAAGADFGSQPGKLPILKSSLAFVRLN